MVVTLNDRPNCSRHPDVIDLSQSAFEVFAPLSRGRIQDIDAQVIGYRNVSVSKKTFDTEVFSDFSVELSRPLSNTYFTKESILLE